MGYLSGVEMMMANYLTHEKEYRSEAVLEQRSDKKVLLLGAGAVGSWLADVLARQGYNSITVLDFDRVESHNFGTQNYGKADLGRSKAKQLAQNIMRRIGVALNSIDKRLTESNATSILKKYDLVFDGFDNAESRELVRKTCEELGIPCLHSGLSSLGFFEIKWNEDYWVPLKKREVEEVDPPCDYPLAANLVHMCVSVTAETINRFIDGGSKYETEFWLTNMNLEREECSAASLV